jgi:hypothetical protein
MARLFCYESACGLSDVVNPQAVIALFPKKFGKWPKTGQNHPETLCFH